MKMRLWISVVIMSLFITACTARQQQYAIDTSNLAVEVATFKKQYARVESVMRQKQATEQTFSDAEWRKLLNVDATIDMLIMKMDAIIRLDPLNISIPDMTLMYNLASVGYRQAYDVISAHWSEFQPSTQILLNALDAEATLVDEKVQVLMSEKNMDITKTLTLITGLLGIAVKMIGVSIL